MSIIDNYFKILEQINETALKYGRDSSQIILIAITKTVTWPFAQSLYDLGQRDFGESRVSEALDKQNQAPKDCHWHLIGTLQKNKVRKAINHFALIHSVDSIELAKKISECSKEHSVTSHILLQANVTNEPSKHGLSPEEWKEHFETIINLPFLSVDGLMTMAPLTEDEKQISRCFSSLSRLREELSSLAGGRAHLKHLSMGMSNDYKIAIAEGATLLRIGSALFE